MIDHYYNYQLPQVLDFDFEKLCSVSLSNMHVYACLVCGKYFQGQSTRVHNLILPPLTPRVSIDSFCFFSSRHPVGNSLPL